MLHAQKDVGCSRYWFSLILVGLLGISTAQAAPSAALTASRTSGPAPLAVFFDATATTHSSGAINPFRDLGYYFDFNNPAAGTWAYSGQPKGRQIGGPLAAHVFDQPGTYSVQVTVRDNQGLTSTASVTITVQNPSAVYSGTNTICLSRTNDFQGCPAGAQQLANLSSWPTFNSNRRYLLRAGQDFRGVGGMNFSRSGGAGLVDAQLGSFGTGARPMLANLTIGSSGGPANWHNRVVVMDMDANSIAQSRAGFDLLLYRNHVVRGGLIDIASAYHYWLERAGETWRNPENIFLVENLIDPNYAQSGIIGNATRFVIMGNRVDRTVQHNIRIWQGHKVFIAHNEITGRIGDNIRHTIKLHSSGLDPVQDVLQPGQNVRQRSSQIVIADNLLGSSQSNIAWLLAVTPQNGLSAEGIEDVVIEDNIFRYGSNYSRDITWAGRRMLERGNTNQTANNRTANYGVGHAEALPTDWRGPYFGGRTSVKAMFLEVGNEPRAPILQVQ